MGKDQRDATVRMFLFPGMGHCSGGDGPSEFPLLQGLMAWVEGGEAPQVMIAHRAVPTAEGLPVGVGAPPKGMPGGELPPLAKGDTGADAGPPGLFPPKAKLPPRSRPVYAYPAIARFAGKGSPDDAASFAPVAGAGINGIAAWVGAGR